MHTVMHVESQYLLMHVLAAQCLLAMCSCGTCKSNWAAEGFGELEIGCAGVYRCVHRWHLVKQQNRLMTH
jgi:hypothetical protein